jgi:D-lactate dehydrogenase (cytochrome)
MHEYNPVTPDLRRRIAEALGAGARVFAPEPGSDYARDHSTLLHEPELVVEPESAEQVARLLRLANEHRFPVTPRGGGTGTAGGCLTRHGGVVLALASMRSILEVSKEDMIARVQPGVITRDLREAARAVNLFYPPDPAGLDRSTVGGNAATGAGGPSCLKYGTTKDYILGLDCVLPTGESFSTGVRTRKGVVGYDLTKLLIGSEGTLGVITSLTLKLIPHPPDTGSLAMIFPDLHRASETLTRIMGSGHFPSALEFIDPKSFDLVRSQAPFPVPSGRPAVIILETDGPSRSVREEIEAIRSICRYSGSIGDFAAFEPQDREGIWAMRRQISTRIRERAGLLYAEDIAVPPGSIAQLIDELPSFESDYGLEIFSFGHAGDGNIHLNMTADRDSRPDRVEKGVVAVLKRVLEMGGTISGEHGIGEAKTGFVGLELSTESLRLQRGIKKLFDPGGILNPGKLFPEQGRTGPA